MEILVDNPIIHVKGDEIKVAKIHFVMRRKLLIFGVVKNLSDVKKTDFQN